MPWAAPSVRSRNMAPVLRILGLPVPAYTLMIAAGFAVGLVLAERRRTPGALRPDAVLAAYFLAGVGSFLGGKLFFLIQGWDRCLEAIAQGTSFLTFFAGAGVIFYGGMAGALAFIFLAAAVLRVQPWHLMDTLLPSLPLAQSFGRVGCLLAGCCYGVPASWGVLMDPASGAPTDTPLLPVQLLEAAGTLAICLLLLYIGRRAQPPGRLLGTYLLCYGVLRFALEFWRGDAIRGFFLGLSVGQWCSMIAAPAGLILLVMSRRRRAPQELPPPLVTAPARPGR